MANQSGSVTYLTRAERIWLFVNAGGVTLILSGVPLLFGGDGSWLGIFIGIGIGLLAGAVFLRTTKPKLPERSKLLVRNPVLRSLLTGAGVMVFAFIIGFANYDLPAQAAFSAAITSAIALGAWTMLMTYIEFKIVQRDQTNST